MFHSLAYQNKIIFIMKKSRRHVLLTDWKLTVEIMTLLNNVIYFSRQSYEYCGMWFHNSWFMMSLRLIACWGQPLYGLVSSSSVGLAPGAAGPVRCVHTSSWCCPSILYMDEPFEVFHRSSRILCALLAYCRSFYICARIVWHVG